MAFVVFIFTPNFFDNLIFAKWFGIETLKCKLRSLEMFVDSTIFFNSSRESYEKSLALDLDEGLRLEVEKNYKIAKNRKSKLDSFWK